MDTNPLPLQKRSRKLIDPKAQLRICGLFAAIGIVMVALQAIILRAMLNEVAAGLPNDGLRLADEIPRLTWISFGITVVLVTAVTFLVGIQMTFKVAGPLHRFRDHLRRVAAGERPAPCRIRADDMLQDFCELLNRATVDGVSEGEREAAPEERAPVGVGGQV